MKNLFFQRLLAVVIIFSSFSTHLIAQNTQVPKDSMSVEEHLLQFNSDYWNAYNKCDIEKMLEMESENLEFYHDEGGLLIGAEESRKAWENFCSDETWRTRAELADSIHIYEMKNRGNIYGGLITGDLSFYRVRKADGKELPDGSSKYTFVLMYENGQWLISRTLSYGHIEVSEKK